jgi:hypothetical protein
VTLRKTLLVNNGNHVGISSIGQAYKRAFESLGLAFNYIELRYFPKISYDQMNMIVKSHLADARYDDVIMIQPTWMFANTYNFLWHLKNKTRFYSIHTEDPYALEGMIKLAGLFDLKFTNEKVVAEKFQGMNFRYLPVAYDSLQPFRRLHKKTIDVTLLCSYYGNRIEYKEALQKLQCRKFIGGNIAYAVLKGLPVDLTGFSIQPGLMPRHKELEVYERSKFVLNPHRSPDIPGRANFITPDKECQVLVREAVSPNPRFFDVIGAGSIPLSDVSRTECTAIMKKYADEHLGLISHTLPCLDCLSTLEKELDNMTSYFRAVDLLRLGIWGHETYADRARQLLEEINAN